MMIAGRRVLVSFKDATSDFHSPEVGPICVHIMVMLSGLMSLD